MILIVNHIGIGKKMGTIAYNKYYPNNDYYLFGNASPGLYLSSIWEWDIIKYDRFIILAKTIGGPILYNSFRLDFNDYKNKQWVWYQESHEMEIIYYFNPNYNNRDYWINNGYTIALDYLYLWKWKSKFL